jgi:acid phosphatase (class A)
MRRRFALPQLHAALLALLLLLASVAAADDTRYIAAGSLDLTALLPPPPTAGSAAAAQDLRAVLGAQAARTPETVAAAKADARVSVFRFADVLGPTFTSDRLPSTELLFRTAGREGTEIGRRAKDHWQRPRPYRFSDEVTSLVGVSSDGSYPSGHALYGCMTAVLLGVIVPEKRPELLARGSAYAQQRVIAGVHYPTDVEAGCTAGRIVAAVLLQSPAFQDALAAAGKETRAALGLPKLAPAD